MVPWFFPLAVLGTVVLLSLSNVFAYLALLVWGWVLLPHAAHYVRSHSRNPDGESDADDNGSLDTHYWRTKLQ